MIVATILHGQQTSDAISKRDFLKSALSKSSRHLPFQHSLSSLSSSLSSLSSSAVSASAEASSSRSPPTSPQHHDSSPTDAQARLLAELRAKDKCGTTVYSKLHGYDVKEYKLTTKDNYVLTLHRIIHPSDMATNGPEPNMKKPYLLLHGLIGSSASFVRNIDQDYKAPSKVFDAEQEIHKILQHKQNGYEYTWQSTADLFKVAYDGDTSASSTEGLSLVQKLRNEAPKKRFARVNELDFDSDTLKFAPQFKQRYRKFDMPSEAKGYITNSLAYTLSNFGYDVWLVNLRGNHYSRDYNGRFSADHAEYWNFNITKLIDEDLLASINFVKQTSGARHTMGLISYSYSSMHVLGLLTKFPDYQEQLQPVVMMAPTVLTADHRRSAKSLLLQTVTKFLVSHNGPFPSLGRSKHDRVEQMICSLPIASKLCRSLETIIYGHSKSLQVSNLVNPFSDHEEKLLKRDVDCGQTSTAVLHQIMENQSKESIHPNYKPFESFHRLVSSGKPLRRSVLLIHSKDDEISTPYDVKKIRDQALKLLTLADVTIEEPDFGHTDFLFSKRNQYLVNGEIARMVTLFDYLLGSRSANAHSQVDVVGM